MISNRISIDQYKSKMGLDNDIVVVAFRVEDKFPATDLMEFIEKGYPAVLDADMSTGEEHDGKYAVFVEYDRSEDFPKQFMDLLKGVTQLCDIKDWRFRYFKDVNSYDVTIENLKTAIPLSSEEYKAWIKKHKIADVSDVLDQGATEVVDIDESDNITLRKPFSGDLILKIENVGDYNTLQESLIGPIQLDESSTHQVTFLEKYLGNYQIHKINNKFLIRNNTQALIVSKDRW